MNLRTMSDSEFLRYANAQLNDLTSTDIERELLRRLESNQDQAEQIEGLVALADEYTFTASELRTVIESCPLSLPEMAALLAALNDEDIHGADDLKKRLGVLKKFNALANDAGDIFNQLQIIIDTLQED